MAAPFSNKKPRCRGRGRCGPLKKKGEAVEALIGMAEIKVRASNLVSATAWCCSQHCVSTRGAHWPATHNIGNETVARIYGMELSNPS